MGMPLFSVIIPAYNRADLIGETLESVFRQEFTDYEVVVADDGSTDGTAAVVARYGDRVKPVRQENRGAGAARNLAIEHAAGEYLAFLDSDDLWFPFTLSVYARVIQEHARPSLVMAPGRFFTEDADLPCPVHGACDTRRFDDLYASARKSAIWLTVGGTIVRTDWARRIGGFLEDKVVAEDQDFLLRLGTAPTCVQIQAPITFAVRHHAGNTSRNRHMQYPGACMLIDQERKGAYPGGPARRRERLELLTGPVRSISIACAGCGELRNGWSLYRKTFGWHLLLARWRYLAAYPLILLASAARGRHSA